MNFQIPPLMGSFHLMKSNLTSICIQVHLFQDFFDFVLTKLVYFQILNTTCARKWGVVGKQTDKPLK